MRKREISSLSGVLSNIREIKKNSMEIQRYKGLGEMNGDELAETTMNPGTRTLVRVKIDDAVKADNIFSILAGKDVKEKKRVYRENTRLILQTWIFNNNKLRNI